MSKLVLKKASYNNINDIFTCLILNIIIFKKLQTKVSNL